MRKRFNGVITNLLLSALVLAWGIAPPAIRHGHEGGEDSSHRHDAVAYHGHDHDDRGYFADEASQPADSGVSPTVLRGLVVHLHWSLLGVDYSMPVSEDDQPGDVSNPADLVVVRLVDSVPTPVLGNNGSSSLCPVAVSQPGLNSPVVQTVSLAKPSLVPSAPLCDRARHERSGVLLV
jgi:hypothetical protein